MSCHYSPLSLLLYTHWVLYLNNLQVQLDRKLNCHYLSGWQEKKVTGGRSGFCPLGPPVVTARNTRTSNRAKGSEWSSCVIRVRGALLNFTKQTHTVCIQISEMMWTGHNCRILVWICNAPQMINIDTRALPSSRIWFIRRSRLVFYNISSDSRVIIMDLLQYITISGVNTHLHVI